MKTAPALVSTASQCATMPSPEEARIVALYEAGNDVSDIVREIWGKQSGRNYQDRSAQVQATLRAHHLQLRAALEQTRAALAAK